VSENTTITVTNSQQGDYPVIIGSRAIDQLQSLLPGDAKKVLIAHAPPLAAIAESLKELLAPERQVYLAELPDAEGAKRSEVVSFCWGVLGQTDFNRTDAIVSLGGGATTDVAGFVCSNVAPGSSPDSYPHHRLSDGGCLHWRKDRD